MDFATLVPIGSTRVRRNYRGGRMLDVLEGVANPHDGTQPESWIASTTRATNPGMPDVVDEGLTRIQLPDGTHTTLAAWIARAPARLLGQPHLATRGASLGFLAKLLDSAMRLQVQAHPTAAFARRHLDSPHGKLETYYVLSVRPGVEGNIRLGFQHAPEREAWRRIIEEQDFAAMDACFEPIRVAPGEFWIVPGGLPHAIGEGVLMVEVMEPSDLVVRCEFARDGAVVPPAARFMGRDLDFCLDIFDYTERTVADVRSTFRLAPVRVAGGHGWTLDRLAGSEHTSCFEVFRARADRACRVANDGRCAVITLTHGAATLRTPSSNVDRTLGHSCFLSASAESLEVIPQTPDVELLVCRPSLTASTE